VDDEGFDRGYWLRHCEAYQVESDGGRLGVVGRRRFLISYREESSLLLGPRLASVPIASIVQRVDDRR
jgi:hypothetical protein